MKKELSKSIFRVIKKLYPSIDEIDKITIEVHRTVDISHGDFYTNIAMKLAKCLKKNPLLIAKEISKEFDITKEIDIVEVASPGYINFFLTKRNKYQMINNILNNDALRFDSVTKKNIHVEYVSANPTGPLHIGHGRGMIVGDTTANFLNLQGHSITREYYVNDAGRQVDLLLVSVILSHLDMSKHIFSDEAEDPDERLLTYRGSYIKDVAELIKSDLKKFDSNQVLKLLNQPIDILITYLKDHKNYHSIRRSLVDAIINEYIRKDLSALNIKFDSWFRESSLYESGLLDKTLKEISDKDLSYEKDGALWFKNSKFDEEKDRVLIKKNGDMTYFATDIAYHVHKFRKFDLLINIWGADHHDYATRLKTALAALGYDVEKRLQIHLIQFANLIRSGKNISMSTRSGDFYAIKDLITEIGDDATRFFYLTKKKEHHLEFDIDVAIEKNKNNPIYYIQYAHARIRRILKDLDENNIIKEDFDNLNSKSENDIIEIINKYEETVSKGIGEIRPDIITNYLYKLAKLFHSYYAETKILTKPIKGEKIKLIRCIDKIILNGIDIINIKPMNEM